jgi:hypothetical protein
MSTPQKTILNFDSDAPFNPGEILRKISTPPKKNCGDGCFVACSFINVSGTSNISQSYQQNNNSGFSGFGGDPSRNLGGY